MVYHRSKEISYAMRFFLLLLLAVPVIELWLLVELGSVIGGLGCVLLVIATAIIGGIIARRQGFETLRRLQEKTALGEPVVAEVIGGVLLLFAGLMLLFPGLLTDILGFLLLIPAVRAGFSSRFDQGVAPIYPPLSSGRTTKNIDIDTTKD